MNERSCEEVINENVADTYAWYATARFFEDIFGTPEPS